MSIASVSSPFSAGSGPAKAVELGLSCECAISGCICMALLSRIVAGQVGYSCLPSIPMRFRSRFLLSLPNKGWGRRNAFSSSWIRRAGIKAQRSRFPKGCICSSCHRIRQSCNLPNACGRSQTSPSPIGLSLRLTSWNRSRLSVVAFSRLIQN